jgi:hypothetical protein
LIPSLLKLVVAPLWVNLKVLLPKVNILLPVKVKLVFPILGPNEVVVANELLISLLAQL